MALELAGLQKSFGEFTLKIDLSVADGETVVLAGPSGCGKTTALNLIAGLLPPDGGAVIINGEDITALPAHKRNVAVVFQDLGLFPHLSAAGNVGYGLFIRGVKKAERRRRVEAALNLVRLSGYGKRRIHELSGGEKQRVAIARALACEPRLLLLDEPFSSLDAPLRRAMRKEFLEIRRNTPVPCVFVTHDREEAAGLGDRIALLRAGSIVEYGTAEELFNSPKTAFAKEFFGSGE